MFNRFFLQLRKNGITFAIFAAFLAVLLYQCNIIYGKDALFSYYLTLPENRAMFLEIVIFSAIIGLVVFLKMHAVLRWVLITVVVLSVAYLHQALISLLTAAGYTVCLMTLGFCTDEILLSKKGKDHLTSKILRMFYFGCAIEIVLIGLLSLVHQYSVLNVWIGNIALMALGAVSVRLRVGKEHRGILPSLHISGRKPEVSRFLLSVCLVVLCIQIAKAGVQADYDGYWYGLRSEYVLANSSSGIFENLGLVGFVYLYSKGTEILMLPLELANSWNAYFIFQQLKYLLIVLLVNHFAVRHTDRLKGGFIAAAVATLPALASMTLTVKPDVDTALFELFFLHFVLEFRQSEEPDNLWVALGALALSYGMKLTALLFSSVLLIGAIPFIIPGIKEKRGKCFRKWYCALPGVIGLLIVIGRTFILTGVPFIAYMKSIAETLGLPVHYPYTILGAVNQSGEAASFRDIFTRLIDVTESYFVNPMKEAHVVIAWGTVLPLFLLIVGGIIAACKKRSMSWFWLSGWITISMIVALLTVSQLDGNYLLLHYIFYIMLGGTVILQYNRWNSAVLLTSVLFNMVFFPLINWSWSGGFNKISLKRVERNTKQYNMQKSVQEYYGETWETLCSDSHNRYVATGFEVIQNCGLACVGESFFDINSANQHITDNPEHFAEYLDYCNIQYILVNDSYSDNYSISLAEQMILDGRVDSIQFEKPNDQHRAIALLHLCQAGTVPEEKIEQLEKEFRERNGRIEINYGLYGDAWLEETAEIKICNASGAMNLAFDEPIEFSEPVVFSIYINDEPVGQVTLSGVWSSDSIVLDTPKGEDIVLRISADHATQITDGRICSGRMWIVVQEE